MSSDHSIRTLGLPRASRVSALDGLRAAAVLAVFGRHAVGTLMPGGSVGVDIFFVISGFVITGLLLRGMAGDRFRFRDFYWSRFTRLMPALAATVGVTVVLLLLTGRSKEDVEHAPLALFYVMNLFRATTDAGEYAGGMLGHTWSLAIEEQFYLIWPVLLLALMRWVRPARRHWVVLAVCALILVERLGLAIYSADMHSRIANAPDTRFDQLLYGCALALFLHYSTTVGASLRRFDTVTATLVWPAIAFLGVVVLFSTTKDEGTDFTRYGASVQYTLVALAATVLVAVAVRQPDRLMCRLLSMRIPLALGTISYSFYLVHYPVLYFADAYISVVDEALTSFVISLVLSVLCWRYIEMRFHRSGRAIPPRAAQPSAEVRPG